MRAIVVGAGAVGARVARQLLTPSADLDLDRLSIVDRDSNRASAVAAALGPPAVVAEAIEAGAGAVVVLANPGDHAGAAAAALRAGASVVSTADTLDRVRPLLALDGLARDAGRTLVAGAAFAPGLSCVLARHAASTFDHVDEIHVARAGAGGPACARSHHQALASDALDWRDGQWLSRRGRSGRELYWFPEPVAGRDCYRAGVPDSLLLVPAFPGVARVTARLAASRRDRLTALMPMLRRPHPEGALGAVRVEVRGRRGVATDTVVLGGLDRPAAAAGVVAAVAARWAALGLLARTGAAGLAELVPEPLAFLQELARRGVRAATFEGAR